MNKSPNRNTNPDLTNFGNEEKFIDSLIRVNNINPQVFYSIKKFQQIPDEVIIDFLNAESSLTNSDLKKIFNNNGQSR